ncbi:MAG TPA: hypothetical protein VMF57_00630 [Solirubrobacteraceae bacterium]|nr:hypothetical protein [Solirubrobacteraceae bacterium]
MTGWTKVSTAAGFIDACEREGAAIEVDGVLAGMPMTRLAPGVRLRGGELRFGAKGLQLTRDNVLEDVRVETAEHELAILNDLNEETLGKLVLKDVETVGQVCLLVDGRVRGGHVDVDGLRVERADTRGRTSRPAGFGVEAMQGAFTLWNRQPDQGATVAATLLGISAGSVERPVRGSGVFVAGTGASGGRVEVDMLRTDEIHADGGITPGTPDLISGGVFVVAGACVGEVVNAGPVTTYGANDMVLDNWGRVGKWNALEPITSHGPSAIGVVNFGVMDEIRLTAALDTHGIGARGFNLYDGTLRHAYFASISTRGDGAVGIQIARELPEIEIGGDLATSGGEGLSLVKGVQTKLPAIALSVQPGGHLRKVAIGGRLVTFGDGVVTLDVAGRIDQLHVAGGIAALGKGSHAVHSRSHIGGLDVISIEAKDGERAVRSI